MSGSDLSMKDMSGSDLSLTECMSEQLRSFEKKASVYLGVVKSMNEAAELGVKFEPAAAFQFAHETAGIETSSNKVTMVKIWNLVKAMTSKDINSYEHLTVEMSLVMGARRHLEMEYQKDILDTINKDPAQASLGEDVDIGILQWIRGYLRIRLRELGVLDFDVKDAHVQQPPVETTWQQVYYCVRTGYYKEARNFCLLHDVSRPFAAQLGEWIRGMVSLDTVAAATEECESMLRSGHQFSQPEFEKKFLLHAIVSGSRKQQQWFSREGRQSYFPSVDDYIWFLLALVRDSSCDSLYSLKDLTGYFKKLDPLQCIQDGKFPLVYPYCSLLGIQLLPAVVYLCKDTPPEKGFLIDGVHILMSLAAKGVLLDSDVDVVNMVRLYGTAYKQLGNLSAALEYYAQAVYAVGDGEFSKNADHSNLQKRKQLLKELLSELIFCDGGVHLLLGPRSVGQGGLLCRFFSEAEARDFLVEMAGQCRDPCLKKQIQRHTVSNFPSSEKAVFVQDEKWWARPSEKRRHTPGGLARGRLEWERSRKCLFCKRSISYGHYPTLQNHQLEMHSKELKD